LSRELAKKANEQRYKQMPEQEKGKHPMKIAYNASAVLANNALFRNEQRLSTSLQRLSSGLKITGAKDNPSGLAMARRMNAQLEGLSVATQNSSDALSVIAIADGAMAEVHDIMQRINELAVKASNEILTNEDRKMIQDEVHALKTEITRIAKTTEFNGQKILDGSFDLRGYTSDILVPPAIAPVTGPGIGTAVDLKVAGYSDYVKVGEYVLEGLYVEFDEKGNIIQETARFANQASIPPSTPATPPQMNLPADAIISAADGNVITITAKNGFELKFEVRNDPITNPLQEPYLLDINGQPILDVNGDPTPNPLFPARMTFEDVLVDLVGFGSMDMQVGANEGQQLDIRIYRLSLENMGISNIDLSSYDGALDALSKMGKAINYVSSARSHLGAYQNRLEHIISNLDISTENMTAAYSRIMDVNMAEEMTEYTTLQILVQASTSMLAQANERPSNVLQLLQ
jgi:flagellin